MRNVFARISSTDDPGVPSGGVVIMDVKPDPRGDSFCKVVTDKGEFPVQRSFKEVHALIHS